MLTRKAACIDSDALVNLLALDCFGDALTCVGCDENSCFRLPSAVAQIVRGRWVGERWPKADRAVMAAIAEKLPVLSPPRDLTMQETLNSVDGVDEGEAYIIAKALEEPDLLILTGDGRMIRALHQAPATDAVLESLRGRVLIFPQIVGGLVKMLSVSEVEYRWRSAAPDTTKQRHKSLSVMFGSATPTRDEEFWNGYSLQVSHVIDFCGEDWLYSI